MSKHSMRRSRRSRVNIARRKLLLGVLAMATLGAGWVLLIGMFIEPGRDVRAAYSPRLNSNEELEAAKPAASAPEPSPRVSDDLVVEIVPVPAATASISRDLDPLTTAELVCPTMAEFFASMAIDLESEAVLDNARAGLEQSLSSDDADVQQHALQTLADAARLGDEKALATLENALEADDHDLRRRAVGALSALENPDITVALADLANDPDDGVRKQVARALGELPKELSGDLLVSMLHDPSTRVVEQALEGLGDLRYAPAHTEIAALIGAQDGDVTMLAGRAMRKIGDSAEAERAIAFVVDGLTDSAPEIRLESLKQIRDIGGAGAVPHLETAALDTDPEVSSMAQEILDRLYSKQ
jgi:HEAT repeat protein